MPALRWRTATTCMLLALVLTLALISPGRALSSRALARGHATHTCIVTTQSFVRCHGKNDHGQLGQGDYMDRGGGLEWGERGLGAGVPFITISSYASYREISVAPGATCLLYDLDLTSLGYGSQTYVTCVGWGMSADGGDEPSPAYYLPAPGTPASVSVGYPTTTSAPEVCIVTIDGALVCWQSGAFMWMDSPQVTSLSGLLAAGTGSSTANGLGSLVPATVVVGPLSCVLLKGSESDSLVCWTGDPGAYNPGTVKVLPLTTVSVIAGSPTTSAICAVSSGSVMCFGDDNNYYQQGTSTTTPQKASSSKLASVSLGGTTATDVVVGEGFACALLAPSGGVSCWGAIVGFPTNPNPPSLTPPPSTPPPTPSPTPKSTPTPRPTTNPRPTPTPTARPTNTTTPTPTPKVTGLTPAPSNSTASPGPTSTSTPASTYSPVPPPAYVPAPVYADTPSPDCWLFDLIYICRRRRMTTSSPSPTTAPSGTGSPSPTSLSTAGATPTPSPAASVATPSSAPTPTGLPGQTPPAKSSPSPSPTGTATPRPSSNSTATPTPSPRPSGSTPGGTPSATAAASVLQYVGNCGQVLAINMHSHSAVEVAAVGAVADGTLGFCVRLDLDGLVRCAGFLQSPVLGWGPWAQPDDPGKNYNASGLGIDAYPATASLISYASSYDSGPYATLVVAAEPGSFETIECTAPGHDAVDFVFELGYGLASINLWKDFSGAGTVTCTPWDSEYLSSADSIDITFVQTVTLRHATPSAFDEMLYPAATVSSSRLVKGLDTIWGKDHAGGFTRVQDYRVTLYTDRTLLQQSVDAAKAALQAFTAAVDESIGWDVELYSSSTGHVASRKLMSTSQSYDIYWRVYAAGGKNLQVMLDAEIYPKLNDTAYVTQLISAVMMHPNATSTLTAKSAANTRMSNPPSAAQVDENNAAHFQRDEFKVHEVRVSEAPWIESILKKYRTITFVLIGFGVGICCVVVTGKIISSTRKRKRKASEEQRLRYVNAHNQEEDVQEEEKAKRWLTMAMPR